MKLRRMEFGRFRTFAEPTTFDFGHTPGLYFLEGGDNEVDPQLGSNGVGKSTVWSALCWILFGKTADGLKAGDLKSWQSDEKGYYGQLWIGKHQVKRTWQPNKLTLDGEVVAQAYLEEQLGLSFDTFISAVVLSQGGDMFLDLTPPRKLALFTSMLKLDNWINYSSMAKATADDLQDGLHKLERVISKLEGNLDGLGITELADKRKSWRSNKMREIKKLRQAIRMATKDAKKTQALLAKAKSFRNKLKKQLAEEEGVEELAFENWTEAKAAEEKAEWRRDQQKKRISSHVAIVKEVKKKKKGTCRHCGQRINKGRLTAHIRQMDDELDKHRGQLTFLATELERLSSTTTMYHEELVEAKKKTSKLRKKLAEQKDMMSTLISAATQATITLQSKEGRLADKRKEKNPFIPLIEARIEDEKSLEERLKTKERKHGRMLKRKNDVAYWVQGFKDVRLFLIEEALVQLEIETNKALSDLGFSTDWRILYRIDKRTKTGSTVSGFTVLVQSPHTKQAVPFAAWSGGEKQRLKIAGSIGFIALMSARTGLELGIEVYDEPTQHLSPEGIDSLLETLRQRALETNKRIWLVDHHTLDYGDFAGRAVVTKKQGGSTVWQS